MNKIDEMYASNGMETPEHAKLENQQPLIEHLQQPGTPFTLVGNPESGYFIALGKYKLSEPASLRHCQMRIEKKDWELLFAAIGVAIAERHNLQILQNDTTNTI